ncbi:unnamed protein product [Rotaria magnacalcarata]|uniref:Integrase catalytic domain-containing protein n=6 Tax=Rotaria magnacalcarata TaxID=392030 RepID=A0A815PS53_9BILA|nr:unnamed protein product [Rotaria magnacalcarata]CAF4430573.1 unnamed protein product [Rotaria magnacalcarata]
MTSASIFSPAKIATASSVTTSSETLMPTTVNNNMKLKNDFIDKILRIRNESLNNPVFTLERYNQTIELINNAKLKSSARRNDQEISLLKTYDVLNLSNQDKLVKKIQGSEDTSIKYYVPINEVYDVIRIAHFNIGHRGIKYTLKEIKKNVLMLPKNKLIRPILSNDFHSRGQVDLIDMQSSPDGKFKFILNYQDHFTKFCILRPLKSKTAAEVAYNLLDIFTTFGAPAILQSDNGREFVAKVIEELALIWKDLKIVHGKPRHPQSQGSAERSNQDTKQLLGTWIRENNSTKWAEGLRFVQFQKNSCFHRVLNNSPYAVLFGNQPKLGLSSTSLHPSIFNDITTEEELTNELGLLTNDAIDVNSCASESEEDELKIDEPNINDELKDNDQLNITEQNEKNDELLTNRAKRTNNIRETARQGQKRQADEFLRNTAKRHKLADLNVGDNVLIPVPDVDRGPTDARNVLAVVMEIKDDKYKLGVEQGIINGYYSFHQISKATGTPTILVENIDEGITKSLREVVKPQSITGGQ